MAMTRMLAVALVVLVSFFGCATTQQQSVVARSTNPAVQGNELDEVENHDWTRCGQNPYRGPVSGLYSLSRISPQVRVKARELVERATVESVALKTYVVEAGLVGDTQNAVMALADKGAFVPWESLTDLTPPLPASFLDIVRTRTNVQKNYTIVLIRRGDSLGDMLFGQGTVMQNVFYRPASGEPEQLKAMRWEVAFQGRTYLVTLPLCCNNIAIKRPLIAPPPPRVAAPPPPSVFTPPPTPQPVPVAPAANTFRIVINVYQGDERVLRNFFLPESGRQSRNIDHEKLNQMLQGGFLSRYQSCNPNDEALVEFGDFIPAREGSTVFQRRQGPFPVKICNGRGQIDVDTSWWWSGMTAQVHLPKHWPGFYPPSGVLKEYNFDQKLRKVPKIFYTRFHAGVLQ